MPFGQNQPISVMAIGIEPHTTAQGEKIDQISMIVVAIAVQSGQIELRGEDSREPQARLSTIDVTTHFAAIDAQAARDRQARPAAPTAVAPFTTGMRAKL